MIIPARYNGPPGSGNGGYSAGVFAGGNGSEVTLRKPPPLDTPLTVVDGEVRTADGAVVAQVGPAVDVEFAVPPVGHAEAVRAAEDYAGFAEHPFPTCFVCGTERADGLRIFPGRMPDDTVAAPWIVPSDVTPAMVWAALDCPGGWAVIGPAGRPYVLGKMAARVHRVPEPGEQCVVRGALASAEGRKALVHSTLYGADGAEVARARATWIAIAG
jgi:hypothetical protein